MEKVIGRPQNCAEREPVEVAVYDLLDSLSVEYERVDHGPVMTMEECEAIDAALGVVMCKNLFLRNKPKTEHYLVLLPADKSFDSKAFSKQTGYAKVSFAKGDALEQYLHIHPGAVTVMGLMNDTENLVQLVIDKEIENSTYIGFHPCVNTSSLKVKVSDLLEKILPAMHHTYVTVDL